MFNPEKFKRWLANHHPDEVVGWARSIDACPIANWLSDTYGHGRWGADGLRIHLPNGRVLPSPRWVYKFALHMDSCHKMREPVTAAAAVKILSDVLGELAGESSESRN